MEVDVMISHGASAFQHSRWYTQSDPFVVSVCEKCGTFASAIKPDSDSLVPRRSIGDPFGATGYHICTACSNTTNISSVEMSYSSKSFINLVGGMQMEMKIIPK